MQFNSYFVIISLKLCSEQNILNNPNIYVLSCCFFKDKTVLFLFCFRWHAKSHRHTDKRDIHLEEVTSKQCTSIDSNLQNVYHIIEPTTENSCNPEANHYYDRIKHLGQKTEYQYEKVL